MFYFSPMSNRKLRHTSYMSFKSSETTIQKIFLAIFNFFFFMLLKMYECINISMSYFTGELSKNRPRADSDSGRRTHTAQSRTSDVFRQTLPHHAAGLQQDVHHAPREAAADTGRRQEQAALRARRRRQRHTALQRAVRHARQRRDRRAEYYP